MPRVAQGDHKYVPTWEKNSSLMLSIGIKKYLEYKLQSMDKPVIKSMDDQTFKFKPSSPTGTV